MPEIDGIELIERLRAHPSSTPPQLLGDLREP